MAGEFVFGVDLDGVCADFYKEMRIIAAEWFDKPLESLTEDVEYGLSEWGVTNTSEYESLHRFAVVERDLFRRLDPMPGVRRNLKSLSDSGIRIRIITHRLYINNIHRLTVEQTVEWLENHGIPYWDLCLMRDKDAVSAQIYVDDAPKNIEALSVENDVIRFVNSTNKSMETRLSAMDWDGVSRIVNERYHTWRQTNNILSSFQQAE